MKIEIWSDIACPWCYIGRRRLEHALEKFEHRDHVEIVWRSFQLDPNAPRQYPGTVNDMLARKYGLSLPEAEARHAQITALAAAEGLDYHFERARPGNSFDAHRLVHLAAHHGLQGEMKERLQKAYFTDGLSFSDHDTLVQLAVEVGLDAEDTRRMLASDAYAAEVRTDIWQAQDIGIQGVPFFVFDDKYAVSGAQRCELFLSALERAWADSHPVLQMMTDTQEAPTCDDDTCAV
jgi:predicted DsbA family dithiol-disulfide isomerase